MMAPNSAQPCRRQAAAMALFVLLWALPGAGRAAAADPLFQSNDLLEVTIEAPFREILDERHRSDYVDALLAYEERDGQRQEVDIRIRARGNFRRENCDYPPVRLKFRKSEVRGTIFQNQDKLKLVIHCERGQRYEQTVLREYLAYRMFNAITDNSFRVRLLRVTYVNAEDGKPRPPRYAFLIEHKKRLGKRIDRKALDLAGTTVGKIDGAQLNLTSVFQYFVGNTDFSPVAGPPGEGCCHNYVLFGKSDEPIFAIPYDFDQSGFVDAPYAMPNPRLGIKSVRTRLYRGRCVNNEHVGSSVERFRERRDDLAAIIESAEGLIPFVRKSLLRYVEDFYRVVDDPKRLQRSVLGRCID
jgi:hypothetical protein